MEIRASEETLLTGAAAFVQLKAGEVELYGERIVGRARELCKLLGRMIKMN